MYFAHNGPYIGLSIPLQRVTSLRRRVHTDVPAASFWLRRVLTTTGAETRQVYRAMGVGGGACSAPLSCFLFVFFRISTVMNKEM